MRGVPSSRSGEMYRAKANHAALVDTACAARQIGLSSISFLAADLTSTAFNRIEPWSTSRQSEIALTVEELGVLEEQIENAFAVILLSSIDPSTCSGSSAIFARSWVWSRSKRPAAMHPGFRQ